MYTRHTINPCDIYTYNIPERQYEYDIRRRLSIRHTHATLECTRIHHSHNIYMYGRNITHICNIANHVMLHIHHPL